MTGVSKPSRGFLSLGAGRHGLNVEIALTVLLPVVLAGCASAAPENSPSFPGRGVAADTTEVCGGGGVVSNGRHYKGGKTGCVRLLGNGKVQQY
jgi:hypothetical protein